MRAGCAVMAVGTMAGPAGAYCEESRQEGELAVVPAGGGVFVVQRWGPEECRMVMVGGGAWVPLRAERRPASKVVLWRPTRRLEPGVVYQVVGVNEAGERVRYARAVAGKAEDRVAPRWRRAPRVVWTGYRAGCLMDVALVELALEVEDESPVRVTIEARALDGGDEDGAMRAVVRPEAGRALVEWPARGEWFLRPGVRYAARACAEDAAGNRSCARSQAVFTAPAWTPEPEFEPVIALARAMWRGEPGPVVMGAPLPAEERLQRVASPGRQVDWRCASAGAAGAAMLLLVGGLAAGRRAARRRVSRTV